jgi:hypothetical protein
VSLTVALHVVVSLIATVEGTQPALVLVVRLLAVTVVEPLLVACEESPP